MLFQLRTDNHIENSEALIDSIRTDVEGALHPRFGDRLRRVEVYVQDVNSHKGGIDKRCSIEAHLAGHQPVVAHGNGTTVETAVDGALEALLHALDHTFGRLNDRHGHTPMGGAES